MKKSFFVLPIFIFCVSTALAESELVHLDLEPTEGQTASYLTVRALSDGLRVSDLTVNDGNCELKSDGLQTTGNSFSNILRAYSMGQTKDAAFKKDKEIIFIVACQVSDIDKVIVKTNKGIQTAQYSESAKPLISIKPPKKDNIFEAKFETKPLNELYQVSIYTCYQDKDEVGEVAEVLNKRDGRKASDSEDLKSQLANELVDVIHYAFAIASLNEIDLNDVILEKDKKASIKYNHERNLEQFMLER